MVRAKRSPRPWLMIALCSLICFGAGGCGWLPSKRSTPPPVIVMDSSTPSCVNAPNLPGLTMLPTPMRVVRDSDGLFWVAMDAQGYENLSRNIGSLRLVLVEARRIIRYYETCVRAESDGQAAN